MNFGFDFEFDSKAKKWIITEASTLHVIHVDEKFFKKPYDKMVLEDYDKYINEYLTIQYPEVMDYEIVAMYPENSYLRFIVESTRIEEQYQLSADDILVID